MCKSYLSASKFFLLSRIVDRIEDKTGKADHNGIHQAEIVSQKNIFRMSSFHQKIGNFFHDDDDRTIALGETTSGPTTRLGTIKAFYGRCFCMDFHVVHVMLQYRHTLLSRKELEPSSFL